MQRKSLHFIGAKRFGESNLIIDTPLTFAKKLSSFYRYMVVLSRAWCTIFCDTKFYWYIFFLIFIFMLNICWFWCFQRMFDLFWDVMGWQEWGGRGITKKTLKQIQNILKPTLAPIKCLAKLVQTAFSVQPIFLSLPLSQDFGKITLLEYIRINILTCYLTFSLRHILTFLSGIFCSIKNTYKISILQHIFKFTKKWSFFI